MSMLEKKPENRPDSSLIALEMFKENASLESDNFENMKIDQEAGPNEPISLDPFSGFNKEQSRSMNPREEKSPLLENNIGLVPLDRRGEKDNHAKDA